MSGATQLCDQCGSPLRPCRCEREQMAAQQRRGKRSTLKARPLSERATEDRYGPLFEAVRELPCWLCVEEYDGPGHELGTYLELGQQGGPTAHHVGRYDAEGLIPVDGAAHDLVANRGGRTALKRFRAWLDERGESLEEVGLRYVGKVRGGGS